eukprot:9288535-Alexandrium_andersonii.AAC.1
MGSACAYWRAVPHGPAAERSRLAYARRTCAECGCRALRAVHARACACCPQHDSTERRVFANQSLQACLARPKFRPP